MQLDVWQFKFSVLEVSIWALIVIWSGSINGKSRSVHFMIPLILFRKIFKQ
jgi:hypothetical protein